ncbi:hypothetical protein WICMUC_004262 [Wickerhamomyces mucosus]|uniref:Uncharacterized protein n=1 Tax=Wickerhamomyces mucosus TaxID=1378264 RepID=A0A9P8TBQ3_9ASCO|nr:hypothetical protein WICMUC_004262 [Wickerhamomyces mucosus]
MNPVTPPRPKTRKQQLYTPKTPFHKSSNSNPFFVYNDAQVIDRTKQDQLEPTFLSPVQTPFKSKKKSLGDTLDLGLTSQKFLFPPTPSTIGSGRSKNISIINNRELPKKKLQFETKLNSEEEEEEKITIEESHENEINTTPKGKLIDEEFVNKLQNSFDSDDSDIDEEFITRKKLINPFMTSDNVEKNNDDDNNSNNIEGFVIKRKNLDKPLDQITLINKRGEKIIRKLNESFNEIDDEDFNNSNRNFKVYRD